MKKLSATSLLITLLSGLVPAQTQQKPQPPTTPTASDEILRLTTELVQTDVVVTDKKDQLVTDLKLGSKRIPLLRR